MNRFLIILFIGMANIAMLVHDVMPHHHHINGIVHCNEVCCNSAGHEQEETDALACHDHSGDTQECTVSDLGILIASTEKDSFDFNLVYLVVKVEDEKLYCEYYKDRFFTDIIIGRLKSPDAIVTRRGPPQSILS